MKQVETHWRKVKLSELPRHQEPCTICDDNTRLRVAALAVIDRWNSPKWDWHKQGPTADLIAALSDALLQDNAESSTPQGVTRTPCYLAGTQTGKK